MHEVQLVYDFNGFASAEIGWILPFYRRLHMDRAFIINAIRCRRPSTDSFLAGPTISVF